MKYFRLRISNVDGSMIEINRIETRANILEWLSDLNHEGADFLVEEIYDITEEIKRDYER